MTLPGALAAQPDPQVFAREALLATGRTRLSDVLQALLPALNAPRPSNAAGSDFARPLTLYGLGADELLLLVDGKRWHPGALLNVSQTIGRGEATADLDAIPLAAVERIELFRAGAAARFGFGAVTGALNIVLRTTGPAAMRAQLGQTSSGDGTLLFADGGYQVPLGPDGSLRLSGELASRRATNRALPDRRPQFFPGDPRNSDPVLNNRVDQRWGDPELQRLAGWVTLRKSFHAGMLAYGFAGWSRESGEAGELWRTASDDRTVRALYPNGFLPLLTPVIRDGAALGGVQGQLRGWQWDASLGYGRNSFRFQLEQSANVSLGPQSPTAFYAGSLRADLLTLALSLTRQLRFGALSPLTLALAGEQRSEGFQIQAGEPDSYRYGAVPIQDGPHEGNLAPIGAQGFPGFQPGDAITRRRGTLAAHAELSGRFFGKLALAAAGRVEAYREFHARGVYQLSAELGKLHGVSAWGGYGTAVRLPSLSQTWFSQRQILVSGNFGFLDRTVPARDPLGVILGAKPLQPEPSRHWTLGATVAPLRRLTLSAGYFHYGVRDRIILSGSFEDPAIQLFLAQQGFPGIQAVRFFANALTTRTNGVEGSASYQLLPGGGKTALQLRLAWSHQITRVRLTDSVPGLLAAFTRMFFDRVEQGRLERGQPRENLIASARAERGRWTLDARAERYGSVTSFATTPDSSLDQRRGARWLGDLAVAYRWRRLEVRLGADNLFNTYPERNRVGDASVEGNSYFGMFPYSAISPFGFSGRFVYLRAAWSWKQREP